MPDQVSRSGDVCASGGSCSLRRGASGALSSGWRGTTSNASVQEASLSMPCSFWRCRTSERRTIALASFPAVSQPHSGHDAVKVPVLISPPDFCTVPPAQTKPKTSNPGCLLPVRVSSGPFPVRPRRHRGAALLLAVEVVLTHGGGVDVSVRCEAAERADRTKRG